MTEPRLRVISLGAGVQSTTMALMAAHGEIGPMPDFAIFADTGDEPERVYEHLNWLSSGNVLPFPLLRTQSVHGRLSEHIIRSIAGEISASGNIPLYTSEPKGMLPRQCSKEFKVRPISRFVREWLGVATGARVPKDTVVEMWIGISTDEASRMKPSENNWIKNRWPLIEQRLSRNDCLRWMERNSYPRPPKSACIFCPYHGAGQWRDLRDNAPEDWRRAVAFDAAIRTGTKGMTSGQAFLHRQRVPLDEVDLSTAEDRGQLNMFNDECEGMCGV